MNENGLGSRPLETLIDLGGQRALVTGGGKGIGRAVAARLVEAGAAVTIADVDPDAATTAAELGAVFVQCDITDPDDVSSALDMASAVGAATSPGDPGDRTIDVLVNNAGIYPTTGSMLEATDEFVGRMLEVNVRAQFSTAREAAKRMPDGGCIINMASIAAIGGGANISAYSASKAALVALTRAFANELGPKGIRVNAIAPGVIDTPGVRAETAELLASGLDIDAVIAANPLRTAGDADHIARAALFLASELACFVNGHLLVVDGGSRA